MMVRTARETGSLRFLLPSTIQSIDELSFDLMTAVQHANVVLGWRENMSPDEVPPEWMWPYTEPLTEWFEAVECERKARYGVEPDNRDEVDMTENELAAQMRR